MLLAISQNKWKEWRLHPTDGQLRPSRGQRTPRSLSVLSANLATSLPCFKPLHGCPLLAGQNPSIASWPVWTYMDQAPFPPHPTMCTLYWGSSSEGPGHLHTTSLYMLFFPPGTLLHLLFTWITLAQPSILRCHLLQEGCLDAPRLVGTSYGLPQLPTLSPYCSLTTLACGPALPLLFQRLQQFWGLQPRVGAEAGERREEAGRTGLLRVCVA